jgi:hypothetical protein
MGAAPATLHNEKIKKTKEKKKKRKKKRKAKARCEKKIREMSK